MLQRWMRMVGVVGLLALALALPGGTRAQDRRSNGCRALDGADGSYARTTLDGPFAAGERVTITGGPPTDGTPTTITVAVNGTVQATAFPGTVTYVVPTDGRYNVDWSVDSGGATWTTSCDPAPNTAPTLTIQPSTCAAPNTPRGSITLLLNDGESAADSLTVTATSSNSALVPQSGITLSGSGASRTLTIAAKPTSGTALITLTVSDGQTTTQQIVTVQEGTSTNETLTGTNGPDIIFAQGGDDTVNALDGNDLVCGGSGNDILNGGAGNDALDGQNGDDRLNGDAGNDTLTGGASADRFDGGADTDTITDYKASEGDTKVNVP